MRQCTRPSSRARVASSSGKGPRRMQRRRRGTEGRSCAVNVDATGEVDYAAPPSFAPRWRIPGMPLVLSLFLALAAAPQRTTPPRAAPAAGAAAKAFPFPTEAHTLPNGLRLVLIPYDSPGLVAYYTLMRVGSRNEPEAERSRYAHFFEHMMFT